MGACTQEALWQENVQHWQKTKQNNKNPQTNKKVKHRNIGRCHECRYRIYIYRWHYTNMYLTVCEIDSNKVINHIHSRIELKIILHTLTSMLFFFFLAGKEKQRGAAVLDSIWQAIMGWLRQYFIVYCCCFWPQLKQTWFMLALFRQEVSSTSKTKPNTL